MMPTALIVEDEPEANRLLSMLVRLRGYDTESAFTGGEALEIVRRRPPDLVFLDLMLPDTNGYDICQALKARRETHQIPVVMVTARLADENRLRSAQVGANDFIPKPYTPDQIFGALSSADAWRKAVEAEPDRGEIVLDTRPGAEPFVRLQLLRGVLLDRTRVPEQAIARLIQAVVEVARDALDWGQRRGVEHVATIRYDLGPDRLALVVADVGGWFAGSQRSGEERLRRAVELGHFDEVSEDHASGELTLVARFPSA